ncbi:hypothetical protein Gbem_3676 [Citrifermentans bemidjiense Bem]|uniref:LITAF domain-containing protein n=1 Tax=Citrifermentans bemidjiense (strain ATCC BAA-1014 / DSM 16622 / JCM 12645 / Bem) TaxID=404380 RepID=B5EDP0_CITBB|nr:hypothetical protein [Citrifermentans bemidjiense]ACH40668.1 hypothetical protein Gbem_3676 [Citrifermentans bemidjiense Bem]
MSKSLDDLRKWIEEEKKQSELRLQELRERSSATEPEPDDEPIRCPKCRSSQITAQRDGVSLSRAAVGGFLFGGAGMVTGGLGGNKILITCLKCGKQWKPGQEQTIFERYFSD